VYTGEISFLGVQILGMVSYAFWSLTLSFVFFYSLKLNHRLRIDPLYEIIGMDFLKIKYTKTNKVQNAFLFSREKLLKI
jgi:ammonia channel protein AmtB